MSNEILRLPRLTAKVGKCRSGIYAAMAQGQFPKPIKIGARSVGWLEAEVDAWIADQIELSRRTQEARPRTPVAHS